MTEEFIQQIKKEGKLKSVSEIPVGVILEADRTKVIIPLCCREGWDSCPHVVKKQKKIKYNIGL